MKRLVLVLGALVTIATPSIAQDDPLKLVVPESIEQSGFAQYLVPRFSLKTSIRITRVPPGEAAQMRIGDEGDLVFVGLGTEWRLAHDGDPRAERFLKWLKSDVGKRTIESFGATGGEDFSAEVAVVREEVAAVYEGDSAEGEKLSLSMCGRCHVINEKNRMNGMGSTPSFAVLRALPEWDRRFATFHELNPHPSFTQIEGVTEAFDPSLPSPIVPLTMTLDDLEAILAYVSDIEAADLGAPVQSQ